MSTDNPNVPPPAAPVTLEQAEKLLRCLGHALNNLSVFGQAHKATQQALEDGYTTLTEMVARQPGLSLGTDKDRLVCDEHIIEPHTALLRTLLRRWNLLALGALELQQGMSREEFVRLVVLLGTAPDEAAARKSLPGASGQGDFAHLQLKRLSYQAVSEDDVVVKKQALAAVPPPPPKRKDQQQSAVTSEILAYLQSPVGGRLTPSPEAAALAAQPSKLAELLLRSADIRPDTAQVAGGEQLGNMVVGCLRRLHGHLAATPTAKTKEGKKAIRQTLVMLEKEVVERLRGLVPAEELAAVENDLSAAVGELVGEVRLDTLVSDYVRKRQQSDTTEQRLIRYIMARQGQEDRAGELGKLQQKLAESGLPPAGWEELQNKSALAGLRGGGAEDAPPLTMLLLRLTELLEPTQQAPQAVPAREQVEPIVAQINTGLATAIAGVEQKMDTLREKIKTIAPLPEAPGSEAAQEQALSRRKIIAILAEIVQELRQPLAVICGAIETLSGGHLGNLPDLQRGMLQLALQSSQRVSVIVDALADIAGAPATLQPDAQIIQRIYAT